MSSAIFEGNRANGYDSFINKWMPGYAAFQQALPHIMEQYLPTSSNPRLLVVGSGTGTELLHLAQSKPNWRLQGVDPSPDMVLQSRGKLTNFPHVDIQEGYVGDLPKQDAYEGATLLLVMHFLPDDGAKAELLRSIAQRLRKGAPLILLDIFGNPTQLAHNLALLDSFLPDVPTGEVQERIAGLPTRLHPIGSQRLENLCREAGFEKPIQFFQMASYKKAAKADSTQSDGGSSSGSEKSSGSDKGSS
ncbi:MAG: class I SAM-dependent methyltransferase, partial [Bacteroidota bacterium]